MSRSKAEASKQRSAALKAQIYIYTGRLEIAKIKGG